MPQDVNSLHVGSRQPLDDHLDLLEMLGVPESGGLGCHYVTGKLCATFFLGKLPVPGLELLAVIRSLPPAPCRETITGYFLPAASLIGFITRQGICLATRGSLRLGRRRQRSATILKSRYLWALSFSWRLRTDLNRGPVPRVEEITFQVPVDRFRLDGTCRINGPNNQLIRFGMNSQFRFPQSPAIFARRGE